MSVCPAEKTQEAEMAVNTSLGDCILFCMQRSIFLRNYADYLLDPQASKLRDEEMSSQYIKELFSHYRNCLIHKQVMKLACS